MRKFEPHPMMFAIIGFILILLKVTGIISWSWTIVLLPFLIPLTAILILIVFVFLATMLFDR